MCKSAPPSPASQTEDDGSNSSPTGSRSILNSSRPCDACAIAISSFSKRRRLRSGHCVGASTGDATGLSCTCEYAVKVCQQKRCGSYALAFPITYHFLLHDSYW